MFTILKKLRNQKISNIAKQPTYNFQLDHFINKRHQPDVLLSYTQCNLEVLDDGLLVVGDFSINESTLPIKKADIKSITLVQGSKTKYAMPSASKIVPSKLSNRVARYLGLNSVNAKRTETKIHIVCQDYQLKLSTSSSLFPSILENLTNSGYADQLRVPKETRNAKWGYSA